MDGSSWRRAPAVDRPPGSNRWGSSSPASQESQSATNSYADKSNSWRRKDGPSADSSSKWGQCAEGKLTSPARSLLKDGSISDAAVCWLHRLPLHTADKIHDGRGGDLAPAQLVSAVSTCESFEEMEGALMLLGKHLDIIPISAAITRLTYLTKQERGSRNAAQASNAGVADMLDYLLDRASTHLTLAQGRQIAPMLHAMAILQHTGRPSVVRAFCQRALHCVDSFVPLATANTIWSLGKLDAQGCDTVVHALLEAAPLSRFNNSLLSMTAFGLAKLGLTRCSLHMDRILDAAIKCINDFNMQEVCNLLWSMSKLGQRHRSDAVDVLIEAMERAMEQKPPCGQDVANSLHALAVLHMPRPRFTRILLHAAEPGLSKYIPQDVSNTLWALAKLEFTPAESFTAKLLETACDKIGSFSPQELANTVWATGKLGVVHAPFLTAAARAVEAHMRSFSPQELSNILYALALICKQRELASSSVRHRSAGSGFKPSISLLDDAVQAVRPRLSQYSAQELSLVAWSLSELQYSPQSKADFSGFLRDLAAALASRAVGRDPGLTMQHITNTLTGLSRFGVTPDCSTLNTLGQAVADRVHDHTTTLQGFVLALHELAQASWYDPICYSRLVEMALTSADDLDHQGLVMASVALAAVGLGCTEGLSSCTMCAHINYEDRSTGQAPLGDSDSVQPAVVHGCLDARARLFVLTAASRLQGLADSLSLRELGGMLWAAAVLDLVHLPAASIQLPAASDACDPDGIDIGMPDTGRAGDVMVTVAGPATQPQQEEPQQESEPQHVEVPEAWEEHDDSDQKHAEDEAHLHVLSGEAQSAGVSVCQQQAEQAAEAVGPTPKHPELSNHAGSSTHHADVSASTLQKEVADHADISMNSHLMTDLGSDIPSALFHGQSRMQQCPSTSRPCASGPAAPVYDHAVAGSHAHAHIPGSPPCVDVIAWLELAARTRSKKMSSCASATHMDIHQAYQFITAAQDAGLTRGSCSNAVQALWAECEAGWELGRQVTVSDFQRRVHAVCRHVVEVEGLCAVVSELEKLTEDRYLSMDLAIYVWHPCDWPAVCMARTPQAKLSMRLEHRGASAAGLADVEEGRVVDSGDADEGTVNASASAAAALPACLPRHAGAAAAPRPAGEMLLAGPSLPSPSERTFAAATTTLAAEIAEADVTAPALPPPAIRVAVEADGPFHWTFPGPPRPTGSTLLRNRALANRGYRLVSIPQHEWDACRSVGGEPMVRWAGAREVWGACGGMGDEMALGAGAGREATWDGALYGAAGSGGGAATGASGAATDSGATDGATDSGGGATGGSGDGLDKVRGGGGYASAAVAVAAAAGLSQSAPAEDASAGHVIDRVQYIRQKLDAALAAEGGLAAFKHIGAMVQQGQHQGHLCRHTA